MDDPRQPDPPTAEPDAEPGAEPDAAPEPRAAHEPTERDGSAEAQLRVRRADPYDAAPIAEILADVGVTRVLAEPDALTRQRLRGAIGDGAAGGKPHAVWVAELGAEVVGFAAVSWIHTYRQGVDGLVSDLFVHSKHRGGGAGTALLDAVKAEAQAVGCQRLVLMSGKGGEAYARDFYPKKGFDEHDELACFMLQVPPEGF